MDWDALVQRLWGIIESRGFEAFSARLRSALPDQSFEPLAQAIECLLASDHADVARSLLGEFMSCHAYSEGIKRRLQMLLLFETRYNPEVQKGASDIQSVMMEVRHLLDSDSFDKATSRVLDALEVSDDPALLELLGRVHALRYASGKITENVSIDTKASIAAAPQDQYSLATDQVDYPDFVWQETSLAAPQVHDSECVKAAETVQAIISATTPRAPDSIEWLVELEVGSDDAILDSPSLSPVIASKKTSPATGLGANASEWRAGKPVQSALSPRVVTARRRSKLYQQEQQALTFIQAHPACSVADLASVLELPMDLADHLVKTLQIDLLDEDRLGRLTIKQKPQLPEEPEFVRDDRDDLGAIAIHHGADTPVSTDRASKPASDIAVRCAALTERSRQLLRYTLDNPGQKTYAAAEALGLSLAVVHSMLDGALGEYLECTNYVIHPRPEVAAALNGAQLEPLHPDALTQAPQAMTCTAAPTSGREPIDDMEASPRDIARAAKLSRLSPQSKRLLGVLYTERHAFSKDLAQKLGLESEQVNQALLGILSDYVTVKHSSWRLDERVVPALRLAGII